MKTIKQIADEIGVSKQAVQKRIAREPLCTCLYPYISTKSGTKYIDETGTTLIKQAFEKNEPTTVHIDVADNQQPNVHSDILKILQDNLTALQNQLEIKDRQIEELTATVRAQAESITADRRNELAGTLIGGRQKLIEDAATPRKRGVLQRIFGKKE